MKNSKAQNRQRRGARVRAKISGTPERPRLVVFRSLQSLEVQLIDDQAGITIVAVSTRKEKKSGSNIQAAEKIGAAIAKKAQEKKITTCVFDRNGYAYHGVVKAIADKAREAGLQF